MTAVWRILVAIGLSGALTFAIVYAVGTRGWYRSAMGRNLMAEALVLAGLFGISLGSALFRPPVLVWLGGMVALDAVLWVQVWLLVRAQRAKP